MKYEPTIGLEIHAELKTKTKMFCDSLNNPDSTEPNLNICPVCTGHPGALPTINKEAIRKMVGIGLALNCEIEKNTFFERKNYFYPDLPKGYQISQLQKPICRNGHMEIGGRKLRVERIHLEEDAGRLMHDEKGATLVDFNRAGLPLMELVTHPDFKTGEEVRKFAQELQLILRYLGASEANMEKGQMRVEVNISMKEEGSDELGTKVEIKNLNSIRAAADAIEHEMHRQTSLLGEGGRSHYNMELLNEADVTGISVEFGLKGQGLEHRSATLVELITSDHFIFDNSDSNVGAELEIEDDSDDNVGFETTLKGSVIQETRGWDPDKKRTFLMRVKEGSADYRYFPEPDLPPFSIDVAEMGVVVPELPQQRRDRFSKEYGLPGKDIELFVVNKTLGEYYEKVVSELKSWEKLGHIEKPSGVSEAKMVKLASNYLITELQKIFRERELDFDVDGINITPENFAEFIFRTHNGEVSSTGAQTLLKEMFETGKEPLDIIEEKDLAQVSDSSALLEAVKEVIAENEKSVKDYKKGNTNAIQFLVGKLMTKTKGKANPNIVRELLESELK